MWTRELAVALEAESSNTPVFLQISRAIAHDIRRGRLRAGDALPGSRTLAQTLEVHRNTVLAAYRELESEGWIVTRAAQGTFVSNALPDPSPQPFAPTVPRAMSASLGFELPPAQDAYRPPLVPRGVLSLGGGVPDVRLLPVSALARAYRRVLRRHGRALLDYGDPAGHPRLRDLLAQMVGQLRGVSATRDNVCVTRGSQMALDLVARAVIRPGDVVAVEALGYRPAWDALRQAGATLLPIPVDAEGLSVEALESACARHRVRMVYVTPHHQYPTTVVLAAGRRMRLLELARARRFAILEDDYDHEFHYDGRPVLPLASADAHGNVLYVGTLSKILAPGLRLGFLVAAAPFIERVAGMRVLADRQGDQALECAVAELLEDGEVQRHVRRARRLYQARRDALVEALRRHLPEALRFEVPPGGMALWAEAAPDIDTVAWAEAALVRKVMVYPASRFRFDGANAPNLRLGFAALRESELETAVQRMGDALVEARRPRRPERRRASTEQTAGKRQR